MLASGLEQFTWAWGGDDSHLSHRLAMDCGNRYVFESCQSLIPKSVLIHAWKNSPVPFLLTVEADMFSKGVNH